jgi:hypothetical protein
VKDQVLDTALALKSIMTQQLDVANKRIDFLEKENAILKERLAVYETPGDSHNSSIPPSKDSLSAHRQRSQSGCWQPVI